MDILNNAVKNNLILLKNIADEKCEKELRGIIH